MFRVSPYMGEDTGLPVLNPNMDQPWRVHFTSRFVPWHSWLISTHRLPDNGMAYRN